MGVYLFYFVAFYNYARSLKRQSTWGVISHPVHWLKDSGRSHWPLSSIRSSDSHGVLNPICPREEGISAPLSGICVYLCKCTYERVVENLIFNVSLEKGRLFTQ